MVDDLTVDWPSKGNPSLDLLFNCKDIEKMEPILTFMSAKMDILGRILTAKYLS